MSYLQKRWKQYFLSGVMFLSFNLYFILLMQERGTKYLWYLDILLLLFLFLFGAGDFYLYRKRKRETQQLLLEEDVIAGRMGKFENREIALHDTEIFRQRLETAFRENCELQDYVARWCHEFKIPLAAGLLMVEKLTDAPGRQALREQLEKMNAQVRSMLSGCRLQSSLVDFQIKRTDLLQCVKASVRNNQFFLIQEDFELDVQVEERYVCTDPQWLVYVLDQLVDNALKYAGEKPEKKLRFWTEGGGASVSLLVEDRGEGIKESDIRRIYERGFTGSNYHNGRYRSTGMGLYMVEKILRRLGHEILVESEYGVYTRFRITFESNDFFSL